MKVICTHPRIHYETGYIYFRKKKIYTVFIECGFEVIKDEKNELWYYSSLGGYFKSLSEIRKEKITKINTL